MPQLAPVTLETSLAAQNEHEYVHSVYDSIADHFSQTRYKPWPLIAAFLASLAPGSIGLDSGTGNGKYLPFSADGSAYMVGLDRSLNLLKIARRAGGKDRDVVLGDALGLGWRRHAFDFAISIATIHHLSTPERRCEAVKSIIQSVNRSSGRMLLYVWAIDQDELSKRVIPDANTTASSPSATLSPAASSTKAQDVLVPWVKTPAPATSPSTKSPTSAPDTASPPAPQVFQRYYHMFAASELSDLARRAASDLGLFVGREAEVHRSSPSENREGETEIVYGMEIVADGWERSNYYLEARFWGVERPCEYHNDNESR